MKLILTIVFLLSCCCANAQFVKGDKFIAGGFSVSVQNSSEDNFYDGKYRSFQVYPEVGFFLNERYAVGGGFSFLTTTNKSDVSQGTYQDHKVLGLGVDLFVKRYFPITEKFFFSMDGSVSYDRRRATTDYGGSESKEKSYIVGLNVSPSLIFFPSPNWAIEGSIGGFNLSHSRGLSDDSKSTSFGLDYGSFSLGFAYFFRKAE